MTNNELEEITGQKRKELSYRLDDIKYNMTSKERVLSGIPSLDEMTKGFEMGSITIWTGFTNAGKTTVMTMIAKKTIEQGHRIFFFNGEQTKEDFKNNLYMQCVEKKDLVSIQYRNTNIYDTYVKKEKIMKLDEQYGNKVYIYNNEMPRNIDTLLYEMEERRKHDKIRVFFLDNFMQIDMKSNDEYREQKDVMEKLRTFAVNKNVHIHLVAHPRKSEKFQTRVTLYDVAGSSNIVNKAYNIITISRVDTIKDENQIEKISLELKEEKYRFDEVSTMLEVLKTKGNRCGLVGLQYEKERKTFNEAPKHPSEDIIVKSKGDIPW